VPTSHFQFELDLVAGRWRDSLQPDAVLLFAALIATVGRGAGERRLSVDARMLFEGDLGDRFQRCELFDDQMGAVFAPAAHDGRAQGHLLGVLGDAGWDFGVGLEALQCVFTAQRAFEAIVLVPKRRARREQHDGAEKQHYERERPPGARRCEKSGHDHGETRGVGGAYTGRGAEGEGVACRRRVAARATRSLIESRVAMEAQATGGDPYREGAPRLAPRGEDVTWRRRVSRSVVLLLVALVASWFVEVVVLGAAFQEGSLVWWAAALASAMAAWVAGATFLFTTPRSFDPQRTRRLGTALRSMAFGGLFMDAGYYWLLAFWYAGFHESFVSTAFLTLLSAVRCSLGVLGMLYVAERLQRAELNKDARNARYSALGFGMCGIYFLWAPPFEPDMRLGLPMLLQTVVWIVGLAAWFAGLWLIIRLRKALRVRAHDWWVDTATLPRVEWSSRALLGDRRIELLAPNGVVHYFPNEESSLRWLGEHEFVEAEQALKKRLVVRGPEG